MMKTCSFLLLVVAAAGCHRAAAGHAPSASTAAPAAQTEPPRHARSDGERKPSQTVTVKVNGKPAAAWTADRLDAMPVLALVNKNGESREGWWLKDLAQKFVGPSARVVSIVGASGEKLDVEQKDWQDSSKFLVLKVSHKGDYKIHWATRDGSADDAVLKGVKEIDLAQ